MKKRNSLLLLLILLMSSCSFEKKEVAIYIASDLHLYSNNLFSDTNKIFTKKTITTDGRVQEYDYQLVQSLVDKTNEDKPNYLVLTGDLSFNGEKDSHLELIKMLDQINNKTKVLVIPGNHDTYQWSYSFINDSGAMVDTIEDEEFKELYANYGYEGAYSYDTNSLSYVYELDDNTWALMLDTSLSRQNYSYGVSVVRGFVIKSTFDWVTSILNEAKEKNIDVISFSHHNMLIHNDMFASDYTIGNYYDVINLFKEYDVKLNFSGHLHIQSIKSSENKFYDIASGSLLDYGNRFGVLKISEEYYDYSSNHLNVDLEEVDFKEYSYQNFYQEYYDKTIKNMEYIFPNNYEEVTAFLAEANAHYFDGDYQKIHQMKQENLDLYNQIVSNYPSYEGSYIESLLEVVKENTQQLKVAR